MFTIDQRVMFLPHTDQFMQGIRFGVITDKTRGACVRVKPYTALNGWLPEQHVHVSLIAPVPERVSA